MKITENQKFALVHFLIENKNLIKGQCLPNFNHKDMVEKWQEITNILNDMPGSYKAWKAWRKTWHDLFSRIKAKVNIIKKQLALSDRTVEITPMTQIENLVYQEFLSNSPAFALRSQDLPKIVSTVKSLPKTSISDTTVIINNVENKTKTDPLSETEDITQIDDLSESGDLPDTEDVYLIADTGGSTKTIDLIQTKELTEAEYLRKKLILKKNYYKRKLEIMQKMANIAQETLNIKKSKYNYI